MHAPGSICSDVTIPTAVHIVIILSRLTSDVTQPVPAAAAAAAVAA